MDALRTVVGIALIAVALRDIFDTLFYPTGGAKLNRIVSRASWLALRRLARSRPSLLGFAGPGALAAVVLTWGILIIGGFSLIWWANMPEAFRPPGEHGFLDALYFSLVTITSIGSGVVVVHAEALRLLAPIETLIGLGVLTASISWILSIYPVLARRRSLAHEVALVREAEETSGRRLLDDPSFAAVVVESLTEQLIAARRDLIYFPITYYFRGDDPRESLPSLLPYLIRIADEGSIQEESTALRLRSAMLRGALSDFAETLGHFLGLEGADARRAMEAYAHDHMRQPATGAPERRPA